MSTATAVRKLPPDTIHQYRNLAAERTKETDHTISMNALYVEALVEYLKKPANQRRLAR